jgi:hypothetical protein
MTHRHAAHAERVVDSFRELLSESGRQHVGEKHFEELMLLVEAAISSAVLTEMEWAADRTDELAHRLRNYAERFDEAP